MFRPTLSVLGLVCIFLFKVPPVHALAGDAAAVLAHCGPTSSDQVVTPSDGPAERVLKYSSIELHFQPIEGAWSYTSASKSGVPLSQTEALQRMPCLGNALQEVTARPIVSMTEVNATEPSVSSPILDMTNDLFLALGGLLICGTVFFAVRPYMKSQPRQHATTDLPRSPTRKPRSAGIRAWPRKADPPSSRQSTRLKQPSPEGQRPAETKDNPFTRPWYML